MENLFTNILESHSNRLIKAKNISALISQKNSYSWVGLYDVTEEHIKMIACTGADPAFPVFPRTKGLNGRAVLNKSTVVVNDVRSDPDYLTTFGKTQSEIIIPVFSRTHDVVGTIDVESHLKNTFRKEDIEFLEDCAEKIKSLWF